MGLVKEPTGFMTSSKHIANELDNRFDGGHAHVPLMAGRAAAAQVYPNMLSAADGTTVSRMQETQHEIHLATT